MMMLPVLEPRSLIFPRTLGQGEVLCEPLGLIACEIEVSHKHHPGFSHGACVLHITHLLSMKRCTGVPPCLLSDLRASISPFGSLA